MMSPPPAQVQARGTPPGRSGTETRGARRELSVGVAPSRSALVGRLVFEWAISSQRSEVVLNEEEK